MEQCVLYVKQNHRHTLRWPDDVCTHGKVEQDGCLWIDCSDLGHGRSHLGLGPRVIGCTVDTLLRLQYGETSLGHVGHYCVVERSFVSVSWCFVWSQNTRLRDVCVCVCVCVYGIMFISRDCLASCYKIQCVSCVGCRACCTSCVMCDVHRQAFHTHSPPVAIHVMHTTHASKKKSSHKKGHICESDTDT